MDPEKRTRLDAFLNDRGLDAVWFAERASFAWLTGGDNVVDAHADVGVAAAGYTSEGVVVVTDTIESPRLADEEVDAPITEFVWYSGSLAEAVADRSPEAAAADFDVPGFETVDASPLRQPLTDRDVEAYRSLGADAAAAVEATREAATPETTERELAGVARKELATRGIDAPVVLVGGEERAPQYRHYTPKDRPLGGYALVSVTATRGGLHASLTRTIRFDPPSWLDRRTRAARRVETTALAATRAVGRDGGSAGDVFEAIQDAYAAVDWDGEWPHHHQGGAAGFAGREWIATPDATDAVELPMAYAWNPTVQGAKSENTWLVTADGPECLTATDGGDTVTVEAAGYDLALDHPV
jgi:Xaa-Pro aminopeptidase